MNSVSDRSMTAADIDDPMTPLPPRRKYLTMLSPSPKYDFRHPWRHLLGEPVSLNLERRAGRVAIALLTVIVSLTAGACSSSGSGSGGKQSSTSAAADPVLGKPRPATGSPVTL